MDLWRISKFPTLDGEGGRLYPARWNSGGQPVTYLAASPAGALLELLVHLEIDGSLTPPTYTLLHVTAPNHLSIPLLKLPKGEDWVTDESITRKAGDVWLRSKRSVLARVPSAILPETYNFLLNPLHPESAHVRIKRAHPALLDARLLRPPSRSRQIPVQ